MLLSVQRRDSDYHIHENKYTAAHVGLATACERLALVLRAVLTAKAQLTSTSDRVDISMLRLHIDSLAPGIAWAAYLDLPDHERVIALSVHLVRVILSDATDCKRSSAAGYEQKQRASHTRFVESLGQTSNRCKDWSVSVLDASMNLTCASSTCDDRAWRPLVPNQRKDDSMHAHGIAAI